jgi:3-hydroxyisobutyrate dehydrogenase-like beta-hydroxyacid dehydrogenase
MRVGWLGLGAMGAPMAGCLAQAGHPVAAYDVMPGRVPDGVIEAASVAEAVAGADAVVVMVATPDQLEQVLAGAADALADGQTVVVMSTVGPEAVVAAAARLAATGSPGPARATCSSWCPVHRKRWPGYNRCWTPWPAAPRWSAPPPATASA